MVIAETHLRLVDVLRAVAFSPDIVCQFMLRNRVANDYQTTNLAAECTPLLAGVLASQEGGEQQHCILTFFTVT
jgi:hypothetical protein